MIVDISKFQTVTSFAKVKNNVEGVIIRLGYRGYSAGTLAVDPKFEQFKKGCIDNNIPFSVYFFPCSINDREADEEADFILNHVRGLNLSFPIFLDSEVAETVRKSGRADRLSATDRTRYLNIILNRLHDAGYACGVYASRAWFNSNLNDNELPDYTFRWVAEYNSTCKYTSHPYCMWQYTSKATCDGISGRVDASKVIDKSVFINQTVEEKKTISVIIGSARIDEHGKTSGGQAGDQKQTSTPDFNGEVSMQPFYVHSKGWYILRAKSESVAIALADAMTRACNNPNIGYDQNATKNGRLGVTIYGTDAKTPIECDCSSLVRACVIEATGRDPGNFSTANEILFLTTTNLFTLIEYSSGVKVCTGDILVTKVRGHTAICVSGYERSDISNPYPIPTSTLRKGDKGDEVKWLQYQLNSFGDELVIDGSFGQLTHNAVLRFQSQNHLVIDGLVGSKTRETLRTKS